MTILFSPRELQVAFLVHRSAHRKAGVKSHTENSFDSWQLLTAFVLCLRNLFLLVNRDSWYLSWEKLISLCSGIYFHLPSKTSTKLSRVKCFTDLTTDQWSKNDSGWFNSYYQLKSKKGQESNRLVVNIKTIKALLNFTYMFQQTPAYFRASY